MREYRPQEIESKWQSRWGKWGIYQSHDRSAKQKLYLLDMFPYPSGAGLHVGHTRIYTASDVLARYFRMKGKNVLHPMGWDAFGLPAENDAIKKKINPNQLVPENIATFKRQMQSLGFSYDWSREINTSDPAYYRWTQWLFVQFFKLGLLYRQEVPINWCNHCKTGIANEEVLPGGTHERCGHLVVKKEMPQWLFRITKYADRLLRDLEGLDWPRSILDMQRNWIGRSEGTEIQFSILDSRLPIKVFTTRPDTIFGVTALVLAPEHPVVAALLNSKFNIQNSKLGEVRRYVEQSKHKSELERAELAKEKTGVNTGLFAINPATQAKIPIWVADYVIGWYGGGAVMLVPAHDQRDYEFAKKYDLPIKTVISLDHSNHLASSGAYEGEGILVNSGQFSGMPSQKARQRLTDWLKEKGSGQETVSYKLRDWVFSRQRYWGEPIPLIHCQKCGIVPVPEDQLPVELPYLESYEPTGTGESPLAAAKDWVLVKCPECRGPAKRETDTMPNWAGSCWYFLRFAIGEVQSSKSKVQSLEKIWEEVFKPEIAEWLPVDWYLGGAEHAVLHLLYSRFWVKAMYDLGLLNFEEPFLRLRSVGMVQGEDRRKMSKSLGNVVNPDEVVKAFGADTLRLYEMFMGPFGQAIDWDTKGVEGAYRFLNKVWSLVISANQLKNRRSSAPMRRRLHKLTKKVGADIEALKFNTAIAAFMEFTNNWSASQPDGLSAEDVGIFLRLLAPFAPHLAEELWQRLEAEGSKLDSSSVQHQASIHAQPWPTYDPALLEEEEVTIVVQVDGRVRDRERVKKDLSSSELRKVAERSPNVRRFLSGRRIKEVYVVPHRLVNFATEPKKI